jgi:hypothetical protein
MAQDQLVRREPISASCNRRPGEGLETQKYSLYPKEHPANSIRWPNMSQICSMGFKSRLMAGQGTEVTASLLEVGGYCSCTMGPGVVIHIHCNRLPNVGLKAQKYSIYLKEHPANCPLRWRLSNGLGVQTSSSMSVCQQWTFNDSP